MRSNCIIIAFALRRRRRAKGKLGRIYWRVSLMGRFLHCQWGEKPAHGRGPRIVHFVPLDPRYKRLPPPLFEGRVKLGDF